MAATEPKVIKPITKAEFQKVQGKVFVHTYYGYPKFRQIVAYTPNFVRCRDIHYKTSCDDDLYDKNDYIDYFVDWKEADTLPNPKTINKGDKYFLAKRGEHYVIRDIQGTIWWAEADRNYVFRSMDIKRIQ